MQKVDNETTAGDAPEDQARAESLAAIQGQVIEAGPAEGAQGAGVSETLPMDAEAEAIGFMQFGRELLLPLYPSLEKTVSDERQKKLAAVAAPLMKKYGWSMGSMFEKYSAEINALIVGIPAVKDIIKGIKADNQARKEAAEREAREKEAAAHANQ